MTLKFECDAKTPCQLQFCYKVSKFEKNLHFFSILLFFFLIFLFYRKKVNIVVPSIVGSRPHSQVKVQPRGISAKNNYDAGVWLNIPSLNCETKRGLFCLLSWRSLLFPFSQIVTLGLPVLQFNQHLFALLPLLKL